MRGGICLDENFVPLLYGDLIVGGPEFVEAHQTQGTVERWLYQSSEVAVANSISEIVHCHGVELPARHTSQACSDEVNDAGLHRRHRKHRLDRLREPLQPVNARDQDVAHAALFELREDLSQAMIDGDSVSRPMIKAI